MNPKLVNNQGCILYTTITPDGIKIDVPTNKRCWKEKHPYD